ncbi:MAG: S-adenosylmethionine decarboxylase, partial [Cyanobacteria bacterium HKST-UBA05]|nr:S-adenosylmethionine decarboxylase [Cyanobacteria bacterium HKST-UBA05]
PFIICKSEENPGPMSYKCIKIEGEYYYGKHLMMTAVGCNEALMDIPTMKQFLVSLSDDIGMVRFGDPIVERFGEGEQTGLSGVQLITTSAITFHTNDQYRDFYLDVFSCKWFESSLVAEVVRTLFNPANITISDVLRQ